MPDTESTRYRVVPQEVESLNVAFEEIPFFENCWVHLYYPAYVERNEWITPNSKGSRKLWKPFQHYCLASGKPSNGGVRIPFSSYAWSNGFNHFGFGESSNPYAFYNDAFGPPGELNKGLPQYYAIGAAQDGGNLIPPPADLNNWLFQALKSWIPTIKPELLSINSLIELKDWKTVPKTIMNIKEALAKGLSMYRHYRRARAAADVYLQTKFNIQPLISDIAGIYRAMSQTEQKLRKLLSEQGRVRKAHFTKRFVEYPDVSDDSASGYKSSPYPGEDNGPFIGDEFDERHVYNDPSVFHAEIRYSYYYADCQIAHARLLGILDSLGINFNAAIIWNAIPWSFVVDWLVNVSSFLSDYRLGNMDPAVCVHEFCWSIKRHRRIFVQRRMIAYKDIYHTVWRQAVVPLPLVEESSYRRELCSVMDAVSSFRTSGLNSTELSLIGALGLTRKHRHRRKRK